MKKNSLISVDEAVDIVLSSVAETAGETVALFEAAGRVLERDIIADINIPPVDNSGMDGYALRHESAAGASRERPAELIIKGESKAGTAFDGAALEPGFAVRIMTGAAIPPGADAVIPVEDTEERGGSVLLSRPLEEGDNIRRAGEDILSGSTVLEKGHRLKPADIGLLASLNYTDIPVFRSPSVAIISTGDELVNPGKELAPGQIRNSSAYALYAEVLKYNARPVYLGIARDSFSDTKEKFTRALECDIVLTTGGVSMGKYDFVKDVMAELGIDIIVDKILMKPGKPLVFGMKGSKLIFGLPGNPVSSLVSFVQFVRPAILKSMGASRIHKPVINALLREDIHKKPERRHFARGFFTIENGKFYVSPTGAQGSGILTSMSHANCFIILREGVTYYQAGKTVAIQLIHHEEI
ncbi:MAG TPA: molybdopterin molybdotransferase MoeA [Spirochaetota bacterium]|nr:molybdopterin molybdotransferase MoeA [Spirochaetota bacterium]HPI87751.1 molybdopterin molybdotransferase MoeA [Spirochaetota bacterium]